MQFRLFAAVMVFAGSYLPLTMILLAQDFRYELAGTAICIPLPGDSSCVIPFSNYAISVPMFLFCLLGLVTTLAALDKVDDGNAINITTSEYVPSDLMNYTLPYVVSFMGLGYSDSGKLVGLCIFLVWMFWITHKSGQILLNPVLIAFGWRLYDVEYQFPGSGAIHNGRLIARSQIVAGKRYVQSRVQDLMVVKRESR